MAEIENGLFDEDDEDYLESVHQALKLAEEARDEAQRMLDWERAHSVRYSAAKEPPDADHTP